MEEVGFITFATLALDGNIWAIDNSDYSLKKINSENNKTIITTNLNFIINQNESEILFMKEYNNFLYISTTNNGILVFDNLGTYKKKLPYNNISFFSFKESDLCFITNKKINYFNTITLELKQEEEIIEGSKILISDKNKFIIE